jgi:hypothetical protein
MDKLENRDNIDWLAPENRFRATPMDLLRQGLNKGDWNAVSACYLMLTGEKLSPSVKFTTGDIQASVDLAKPKVEPPKRKRGRPKKTKQEDVIVQEKQPSPVYDAFADCVAPARASGKDGKVYTKATTHDCRPHPNTWSDDGNIAQNEIIKNREVPESILQAKRNPWPEVKIRCSSCGTTDKVEAGLVPNGLRLTKNYSMSYRCNDCIIGNRPALDLEVITDEQELLED